jgi:hypothetical protein
MIELRKKKKKKGKNIEGSMKEGKKVKKEREEKRV